MTFPYRFFNKPQNLKEIIEKGKNLGIKEAEVVLYDDGEIGLGDVFKYKCNIVVKIGEDNVKVGNQRYQTQESSFYDFIKSVANVLQRATEDVTNTKKELEENGLEAKVNIERVEETFDAFEDSNEIIEKIKNILNETKSYERRALN